MNEKFPNNERERLEAKLTALLLGELPAHEEAALHRAMDEDPELAALYERLKATIELMKEGSRVEGRGEEIAERAVRRADLKLSPDKREKLLAHFKTVRPKEFAEPPRKRVLFDNRRVRVYEWAAIAAVAVFFAAITIPNFVTSRSNARKNTVLNNLRLLDGAKQTWALEVNASPNATPSPGQVAQYFGRGGTEYHDYSPLAMPGVTYVTGKVGETPGIETSVSQARRWMGGQRIPQDRIHNGQVELSMDEMINQKFNQNPAPQVAMNTPWQTRFVQTRGKGGPSEQSDFTLPFKQFSKGDSQVQDTSKLLDEIGEARRAAIAKGGEERPQSALISREMDQTATFAFDGKPAPAPPKPEIFLPSGNEAAGNEQLALNNADFGKFDSINGKDRFINGVNLSGATNYVNFADSFSTGNGGSTADNPSAGFSQKTPILGDIPSLGAVFQSQSGATETNGQFYTGLSHDDVSGFSYLVTNGVEAPQLMAGDENINLTWKAFDGTSNTPTTISGRLVQNDGDRYFGLVGTNSFAGQLTVQGGSAPADYSQSARDTEQTRGTVAWTTDTHNKAGNITLADGSAEQQNIFDVRNRFQSSTNAVQNGFASAAPEAAPPTPQPTAKDTKQTRGESHGFAILGPLPSNVGNAVVTVDPNTHNLVILSDSGATTNEGIVLPQPSGGGASGQSFADRLRALKQQASAAGGKQVEMAAAADHTGTPWMTKFKKPAESGSNDARALGSEWYLGNIQTNVTAAGGTTPIQSNYIYNARVVGYVNVTNPEPMELAESKVDELAKKSSGSDTSPEMFTRTFKIDPNTFYSGLQSAGAISFGKGSLSTNRQNNASQGLRYVTALDPTSEIQNAINNFFSSNGINLGPSNAVFFNDRQGTLTVHATAEDLGKVQTELETLDALRTNAPVAPQQTDTAPPNPTVPPPTPQPEILTRENAFSTFSMNVSDVSFKLAAASLEKGQMPEPASIRSEEFINAFDYRDPEAAPGVPVAFNYERALYPFAHNRELLRFSLKTAAAGRQAGRPLNVVLLLDNSGSMERADRVAIIQEALRVLAGQLQAQDTFSIVTFARTARLRVDGIPGNQAAAAADTVGKFTPEGGTDLGDALDVAYETALHHYLPNGDNRVVMLTDGAANLGDVDANSLKQKVETHRKQGIALDCFGIGWEGYNDDLLEVLTRDGDGRYGFINTPEEASTEFVSQIAGALHVAAADVKVQVEFNPDRVISYRQIGYAKHQLTKEQFRDNTVAAGQIAAQEAGNALYTIEVNPQGQGSIGTVRVRYKVPDTGEVREQSWDVPYTGTAGSLEQASPAMRLATTASAFSEWLATSPFAEEVTTDQLLNYLSGVPQVYGADTRPQKLEWMIRQAKSISGK